MFLLFSTALKNIKHRIKPSYVWNKDPVGLGLKVIELMSCQDALMW